MPDESPPQRREPNKDGGLSLEQYRESLEQQIEELYDYNGRLFLRWDEELISRSNLVQPDGTPDEKAVAVTDAQIRSIEERIKNNDKKLDRLTREVDVLRGLETNAQMEGRKLAFEWLKQQTVLGTGSVVILSGLAGNVLQTSEWKIMLVVAVVALFISVATALFAMRLLHILVSVSPRPQAVFDDLGNGDGAEARHRAIERVRRRGLSTLYAYTNKLVQGSFVIGILALLLFLIVNLF